MDYKKVNADESKQYSFRVSNDSKYDFLHGIKEVVIDNDMTRLSSKRAVFIAYSGLDSVSSKHCEIIAEAVSSAGYKAYIFDAAMDKKSSAGKIIGYFEKLRRKNKIVMEKLPTLGRLFINNEIKNAMRIEKSFLNSEIAKIMSDVFITIPPDMPVIACDPMIATACRNAGIYQVYNIINDTEIFGENLSEKAINVVQVLSSYLKYRIIERGVRIPEESIIETGYLIDNTSFENIESDCNKRYERIKNNERKRVFFDIENIEEFNIEKICDVLLKNINYGEMELYINFGDKNGLRRKLLKKYSDHAFNIDTAGKYISFNEIENINEEYKKIVCFGEGDKILNSYISNELLRNCDFAICGYSSLASFPIPKIVFGDGKTESRIENKEIMVFASNYDEIKEIVNLMINEEHILKAMIKNVIKFKKIGMYNGAVNLIEKIFE